MTNELMSDPIPLLVNTETLTAPATAQTLFALGAGPGEQAASNFNQVLSQYLQPNPDNQALFNAASVPVEPPVHGNALPLPSSVAAPSTVPTLASPQPVLGEQTGKAAATIPILPTPQAGLGSQTGTVSPTIARSTSPQLGPASQTRGVPLRADPRQGMRIPTGMPVARLRGDPQAMQEAVQGKGLPNPIITPPTNTQSVTMPVGEVLKPAQGEVTSHLFEALAGRTQIANGNTLGHEMFSTPSVLVAAYHLSADPQLGVSSSYSSYAASGLSVPLGQPGWDQALGGRLQWMVNQNIQQADLRLNPPQLGSLEVRITVQNDQTHVSFTVHHSHAREAIEDAIPRLREMFSAGGLTLGDVNVSQQPAQHRHGHESDGPVFSGAIDTMIEEGADQIALPLHRAGQGLIDLYV